MVPSRAARTSAGVPRRIQCADPLVVEAATRAATTPAFFLDHHRPNEAVPYLRIARIEGGYFLQHVDGIDLEVLDGGYRVLVTRLEPSLSQAAVDHILLDQLLPLVAAHRGQLSFHGSGVAWGDTAVGFLADSGTGKSTLAAALVAHAGARFAADDHVLLEEREDGFVVQPSYPSVRLWTASAQALFVAEASGTKRKFDLPSADGPLALRALVLLQTGAADGDLVSVEELSRRDGLVGMAAHLDRLDPTDRVALRREVEALGRLTEHITIVRMRIVRDLNRLGEAARAVRDWVGSLD